MKINIEIDGKERTLLFDMYAYEEAAKFGGKGTLGNVHAAIFGSLRSWYYSEGKEEDFTRADVIEMTNILSRTNDGLAVISKITETMVTSEDFKALEAYAKELTEEEKKSPLIGTGSTPLRLEKSA